MSVSGYSKHHKLDGRITHHFPALCTHVLVKCGLMLPFNTGKKVAKGQIVSTCLLGVFQETYTGSEGSQENSRWEQCSLL